MKKITACLLALLIVLGMASCAEDNGWKSQYELGLKNLEKAKEYYSQAASAFQAAIECDPNHPEIYTKAAEAYQGMGDLSMAIEMLERGYSATGEESLAEEAARLRKEKEQQEKDAEEDADKDTLDEGTPAADPSSLPDSSTPSAASDPQQDSAAELGIDPETFGKKYKLVKGTGTLRMRAQPSTDSEIIGRIPESYGCFTLIKEEDGWAYGFYAGQLGWCSMDYLELNKEAEEKWPDFLTWEQKILYLRASSFYAAVYYSSEIKDTSNITPVLYRRAGLEMPCYETQCFNGSYATYRAVVYEIFAGTQAEGLFGSMLEINGKPYLPGGDRGNVYGVQLQDYSFRLESQTDDRIKFVLTGEYFYSEYPEEVSGPYTQEWPIDMKKCEDGQWRIGRIVLPYMGNSGFEE